MGSATFVPETGDAEDGGAARATLRREGRWQLLKDTTLRYVAADGTSHTRALAFSSVIGLFPAMIAVIGFATAFHFDTLRTVVERTATGLAPGNSSQVLTQAFHSASSGQAVAALVFGGAAMLFAGTTAMAQLERSANRLYGIERDRSIVSRYIHAFLLYITAGVLLLVGLVLLAGGAEIGHTVASAYGWSERVATAWAIARWPVGIVIVAVAVTILFRKVPNRHQPHPSWLTMGSLLAVLLWVIFTAGLALYYGSNGTARQTYGPLLGVIALLVWSYLSSLALHLGLAFTAQLEAKRAGVRSPREKTETSHGPVSGKRSVKAASAARA
jgi:YihY family inner membrane protein